MPSGPIEGVDRTHHRPAGGRVFGPGEHVLRVTSDITKHQRSQLLRREADCREDEFLATLANELRNPLASIANGLALLQMHGSTHQVQRMVPMMQRQINGVGIAHDVLPTLRSRITAGKRHAGHGPAWGWASVCRWSRNWSTCMVAVPRRHAMGWAKAARFGCSRPCRKGHLTAWRHTRRTRHTGHTPIEPPCTDRKSPGNVQGLAAALRALGHVTGLARTAQDGLNRAERFQPDVLLPDVGPAGRQLLPGCPQVAPGAAVRRAFAGGAAGLGHRKRDRQRAGLAGFDAHLTKPVQLSAMKALQPRDAPRLC